ncbi:MAG: hypothetical protein ACM31C_25095 [Acidobacteriota bacterium]
MTERLPPIVERSLAARAGDAVLMAIVIVPPIALGALVLVALGSLTKTTTWLAAGGTTIAGWAVLGTILLAIDAARATSELARLARLPFAFERDGYVRSLDHEGDRHRLRATIAFAAHVDHVELEAACKGIGAVSWTDDTTAELASEPLATVERGRAPIYNNGPVHRRLRALVARLAARQVTSLSARCEPA